jgi:hypothetical protein
MSLPAPSTVLQAATSSPLESASIIRIFFTLRLLEAVGAKLAAPLRGTPTVVRGSNADRCSACRFRTDFAISEAEVSHAITPGRIAGAALLLGSI